MPIYAYKCSACGNEQDVLQKMSDPVLTQCPQCLQDTYVKQVTAASFRLKGTGWYVTDFRDNDKGKQPSSQDGATSATDSASTTDSAPSTAAAPAQDAAGSSAAATGDAGS